MSNNIVERIRVDIKKYENELTRLMVGVALVLRAPNIDRHDNVRRAVYFGDLIETVKCTEGLLRELKQDLEQHIRVAMNQRPPVPDARAIDLIFQARRREETRPRRFVNPGDREGDGAIKKLRFE